MSASIHLCCYFYPRIFSSYIECPHTFWAVYFMRRQRKQTDLIPNNINRNFPDSLSRVTKKYYVMFGCYGCDLFYRVNNTSFIVRIHDCNQNGCRPDVLFEMNQIDPAILLYRQVSNFSALFLKMLAGIQDCLMFCCAGDDMIALRTIRFIYTFHRKVYAFSGAGCKD